MRVRRLALLALAAVLGASACAAAPEPSQPERPRLGLMTTLPLVWAEAEDVGELLKADARAGWVRRTLEDRYALEPLDAIDEASLSRIDVLMLAQPRPLSPAENVALDAWVRRGGRLLLFADPMLTSHSRFPIGDRRRPQDVVLLSPILTHWGLDLQFDAERDEAERTVEVAGIAVPVDLEGRFRTREGAACDLAGSGVLAQCRLGKGRVVALADAAVLDGAEDDSLDARGDALSRLAALAFD